MFAPSACRPLRDERAGACGQGLPLILQHNDIAECRFGLDRPQIHQPGRIDTSAPRRTQDFFERNTFPFEPQSDFFCVRPSLGAEVTLGGTVLDAEIGWIANTTRRIGMAH